MEEYTVVFINETEQAILVSDSEDSEDRIWLPKSQIELVNHHYGHMKKFETIEVEIPDWLATEVGLA